MRNEFGSCLRNVHGVLLAYTQKNWKFPNERFAEYFTRILTFIILKCCVSNNFYPLISAYNWRLVKWCLYNIQGGRIPLDFIIIIDEAYFYLDDDINKQTLRYTRRWWRFELNRGEKTRWKILQMLWEFSSERPSDVRKSCR